MSENTTRPTIVVGVDGSEPSVLALRWAAALAPLFGNPTIKATTTWEFYLAPGTFYPAQWDLAQDAHILCTEAISKAFGDTPPPQLEIVVQQGPAAKTLIEASNDASLLVLGSRGYGGFKGLLLGAVSSTVAEHAKCAVLLAHGMALPPGLELPTASPAEPHGVRRNA